MVLNATGPPRGVVVPVVDLVYSDPLWSTLLEILPKMWIKVDQGGPGGPWGPKPPLVDQEWFLHFADVL